MVEEAPLVVPDLSRAHTVEAPSDEANSWAPYSVVCPAIDPDQVKVMVWAPVAVTLPNQISVSTPPVPMKPTPLVQVVTPPPASEDTVAPVVPASAKTASTSPMVWGVTARVVMAVPVLEVKAPTAVMTTLARL